jgi:hypothetical protein
MESVELNSKFLRGDAVKRVPKIESLPSPAGDGVFPFSSGERERQILKILFILSNDFSVFDHLNRAKRFL